ncbi:hypothetical protein ACOQFV_09055 [Nocardiopsis changdeensis]|uniref:Uncharacterized protein n=1 Tax=Nocardiopsis changdeensis TaxID=2831969 RepID=A0ABX8BDI8_9ACTN|nr:MULTISPECIES: hypothetical protein [Nocardiopsis]QUX20310.1 hypothetical protein KGD84_17425 [Nocardiopsis changdeensis]QYX36240.1 hypothetical protein K1J57_26880 [Nocardiopsis sp. MT53]
MPHVKIGYPHKGKDGSSRQPGDIVWVGPQEARDIIAGGKGKEVKLSPEEIVELQRAADKAAAEKEKATKPKAAAKPAPEAPKADTKAPARKPSDG